LTTGLIIKKHRHLAIRYKTLTLVVEFQRKD